MGRALRGGKSTHRFATISLRREKRKGAEGHFFKFCSLGRPMSPHFWTNGPFRVVNGVKCWMNA